MKPNVLTALIAACVAPAAWAAPGADEALRIANAHGCMACHAMEAAPTSLNGPPPQARPGATWLRATKA